MLMEERWESWVVTRRWVKLMVQPFYDWLDRWSEAAIDQLEIGSPPPLASGE